jgi:hypothetical protein
MSGGCGVGCGEGPPCQLEQMGVIVMAVHVCVGQDVGIGL